VMVCSSRKKKTSRTRDMSGVERSPKPKTGRDSGPVLIRSPLRRKDSLLAGPTLRPSAGFDLNFFNGLSHCLLSPLMFSLCFSLSQPLPSLYCFSLPRSSSLHGAFSSRSTTLISQAHITFLVHFLRLSPLCMYLSPLLLPLTTTCFARIEWTLSARTSFMTSTLIPLVSSRAVSRDLMSCHVKVAGSCWSRRC
jgi:hypothetical protein